ncbi:MAG: hypothetical protein IT458_17160 [Planctomycetes bacterium]|nr:hypothetical protein [Planctomycetota bacterium]
MLPASADDPRWKLTLNGVLWTALTVGALAARRRQPRDARGAWTLVAVCCALVLADKLFDLQTVAYSAGKAALRLLDPAYADEAHRVRLRLVLLPLLTLASLMLAWWLVRRDQHLDRAKALALAALAGVVAYVGLRLVPGLRGFLAPPRGWWVEWGCCILLATGEWLGCRRPYQPGG